MGLVVGAAPVQHTRMFRSPLSVGTVASVASALSPAGVDRRDDSAHLSPDERTQRPTHLEVVMRMLLKAVLDTEAANEVFRSGAASEALDRIQEALQPEALYGFVEDGQRAFFAVFDLADPSQIPVISEPLFQRANVKITLTPCMTLEDVKKGVEEAARRMAAMQS
jgi:hypothetical protein